MNMVKDISLIQIFEIHSNILTWSEQFMVSYFTMNNSMHLLSPMFLLYCLS